ncbi:hypothetical protein ACFOM8_21635 [Paracoccus angustae]|uniref:Beta sliding clamp n=1 Tax=Paracoccus angustae TaxID=1671480 RepID=A0ABV7UAL3_9RHOB
MHIEINAKVLAAAATAAAKVAGRKTAVAPIYHHALLEADAAGLTMTAVDDRVSLRRRVGVEHVHRAGDVCLPADTLSALAAKIPPAATVSLEYDQDASSVMLSFGRARHEIPCMPGEEFPPIASDSYESSVEVDAAGLSYGLLSCAPFAEKDIEHVTYALAGVHVRKTGGAVEMIAASKIDEAVPFIEMDDPDLVVIDDEDATSSVYGSPISPEQLELALKSARSRS